MARNITVCGLLVLLAWLVDSSWAVTTCEGPYASLAAHVSEAFVASRSGGGSSSCIPARWVLVSRFYSPHPAMYVGYRHETNLTMTDAPAAAAVGVGGSPSPRNNNNNNGSSQSDSAINEAQCQVRALERWYDGNATASWLPAAVWFLRNGSCMTYLLPRQSVNSTPLTVVTAGANASGAAELQSDVEISFPSMERTLDQWSALRFSIALLDDGLRAFEENAAVAAETEALSDASLGNGSVGVGSSLPYVCTATAFCFDRGQARITGQNCVCSCRPGFIGRRCAVAATAFRDVGISLSFSITLQVPPLVGESLNISNTPTCIAYNENPNTNSTAIGGIPWDAILQPRLDAPWRRLLGGPLGSFVRALIVASPAAQLIGSSSPTEYEPTTNSNDPSLIALLGKNIVETLRQRALGNNQTGSSGRFLRFAWARATWMNAASLAQWCQPQTAGNGATTFTAQLHTVVAADDATTRLLLSSSAREGLFRDSTPVDGTAAGAAGGGVPVPGAASVNPSAQTLLERSILDLVASSSPVTLNSSRTTTTTTSATTSDGQMITIALAEVSSLRPDPLAAVRGGSAMGGMRFDVTTTASCIAAAGAGLGEEGGSAAVNGTDPTAPKCIVAAVSMSNLTVPSESLLDTTTGLRVLRGMIRHSLSSVLLAVNLTASADVHRKTNEGLSTAWISLIANRGPKRRLLGVWPCLLSSLPGIGMVLSVNSPTTLPYQCALRPRPSAVERDDRSSEEDLSLYFAESDSPFASLQASIVFPWNVSSSTTAASATLSFHFGARYASPVLPQVGDVCGGKQRKTDTGKFLVAFITIDVLLIALLIVIFAAKVLAKLHSRVSLVIGLLTLALGGITVYLLALAVQQYTGSDNISVVTVATHAFWVEEFPGSRCNRVLSDTVASQSFPSRVNVIPLQDKCYEIRAAGHSESLYWAAARCGAGARPTFTGTVSVAFGRSAGECEDIPYSDLTFVQPAEDKISNATSLVNNANQCFAEAAWMPHKSPSEHSFVRFFFVPIDVAEQRLRMFRSMPFDNRPMPRDSDGGFPVPTSWWQKDEGQIAGKSAPRSVTGLEWPESPGADDSFGALGLLPFSLGELDITSTTQVSFSDRIVLRSPRPFGALTGPAVARLTELEAGFFTLMNVATSFGVVNSTASIVPTPRRSVTAMPDQVYYLAADGKRYSPAGRKAASTELPYGLLFNGFNPNGDNESGQGDVLETPSSTVGSLALPGIAGTPFDLSRLDDQAFTITFWLRASRHSRGLVFAVSDSSTSIDDTYFTDPHREPNWGASSGAFVHAGVGGVIDHKDDPAWVSTHPNRTTMPGKLYAAVYVNGVDQSLRFVMNVYVAMSGPPSAVQEQYTELRWSSTVTSGMFDNNWHFIALRKWTHAGRASMQLLIDAFTRLNKNVYKQCLPSDFRAFAGPQMPPSNASSGTDVATNPNHPTVGGGSATVGTLATRNGGVMRLGMFNGGLYSLTVAPTALSAQAIAAMGAAPMIDTAKVDVFESRLSGGILVTITIVAVLFNFVSRVCGGGDADDDDQDDAGVAATHGAQRQARTTTSQSQAKPQRGFTSAVTASHVRDDLGSGDFATPATGSGDGDDEDKDEHQPDVAGIAGHAAGGGASAASQASQASGQLTSVASSGTEGAKQVAVVIPIVAAVFQGMALNFSGWTWPLEFELPFSFTMFVFSLDFTVSFPVLPGEVTFLLQFAVAILATVFLVLVREVDEFTFQTTVIDPRQQLLVVKQKQQPDGRTQQQRGATTILPALRITHSSTSSAGTAAKTFPPPLFLRQRRRGEPSDENADGTWEVVGSRSRQALRHALDASLQARVSAVRSPTSTPLALWVKSKGHTAAAKHNKGGLIEGEEDAEKAIPDVVRHVHRDFYLADVTPHLAATSSATFRRVAPRASDPRNRPSGNSPMYQAPRPIVDAAIVRALSEIGFADVTSETAVQFEEFNSLAGKASYEQLETFYQLVQFCEDFHPFLAAASDAIRDVVEQCEWFVEQRFEERRILLTQRSKRFARRRRLARSRLKTAGVDDEVVGLSMMREEGAPINVGDIRIAVPTNGDADIARFEEARREHPFELIISEKDRSVRDVVLGKDDIGAEMAAARRRWASEVGRLDANRIADRLFPILVNAGLPAFAAVGQDGADDGKKVEEERQQGATTSSTREYGHNRLSRLLSIHFMNLRFTGQRQALANWVAFEEFSNDTEWPFSRDIPLSVRTYALFKAETAFRRCVTWRERLWKQYKRAQLLKGFVVLPQLQSSVIGEGETPRESREKMDDDEALQRALTFPETFRVPLPATSPPSATEGPEEYSISLASGPTLCPFHAMRLIDIQPHHLAEYSGNHSAESTTDPLKKRKKSRATPSFRCSHAASHECLEAHQEKLGEAGSSGRGRDLLASSPQRDPKDPLQSRKAPAARDTATAGARPLPERSCKLVSFVCPVDGCGVTVCRRCCKLTSKDKVKLTMATSAYDAERNGSATLSGTIALLLAQSLYLPSLRSAALVIFCHSSLSCSFETCYRPAAPFFLFMVLASTLFVFIVGFGLFALMLIVTFQRKKRLIVANAFSELSVWGKVWTNRERLPLRWYEIVACDAPLAEWSRCLESDRCVFKSVYEQYEFKYMMVQPVTLSFKLLLVAAVLFFAEPNSLGQLLAVAAVEVLQLLFLSVTNPFIEDSIDTLSKIGGMHQVLQLGLMCFYRSDLYTATTTEILSPAGPGGAGASLIEPKIMIAVSSVYIFIVVGLLVWIIGCPMIKAKMAARRQEEEEAAKEDERRSRK